MKQYFNDSPIERPEDDLYGVSSFAKSLAQSIRSINDPVGATIALNGQWGSGKTSVINIVRREIENASDDGIVISDFKCWWYRGQDALALAFLQNLNSLLINNLPDKFKDLVPQIGQLLLQAGPVIGPALSLTPVGPFATLTGSGIKFAQRFFPKADTLDNLFRKLTEALAKEERRFLIIVDDIDRLSLEEVLAVFRVIKSVGCLPNVIYLIAFDRALVEKTITKHYPSEGPHFLEKIIQASFHLPMPLQKDLNDAILNVILDICNPQNEDNQTRFFNIFYDVVAPYITTPRHVVRFRNAISVTWPTIVDEVNFADFIALETLRLYEPFLFHAIHTNKQMLCSLDTQYERDQNNEIRLECFLSEIKEEHHETAMLSLQRLFPNMEDAGYTNEFLAIWDAERRVCIDSHFDTYFRLTLSEEALSIRRIDEIITKADDRKFIQALFRDAATTIRKSGTSMVPVLLVELTTHAPRVPREKIEPLLSVLFEIHDDIDLSIDNEYGLNIANTTLRYHWLIRRLIHQKFSLQERTQLYLAALRCASLGWLVDFVISAKNDNQPRENRPYREENHLVSKDAVNGLIEDALKAIRTSAQDNSLLYHQDLIDILYRWRDFLENDLSEVRAWTEPLLQNDEALVIFARELTGKTYSQGVGVSGLGDRVVKEGIRVQTNEATDLLNVEEFLARLERLQTAGTLDESAQKIVDDFLEAWRRQ